MSDNESGSWFSDVAGDGSSVADQLQSIKKFAYRSFDRLDQDNNGYISRAELEEAIAANLGGTEQKFLVFLLDNHEQISEASEDASPDGISRQDLDLYFELISTLL